MLLIDPSTPFAQPYAAQGMCEPLTPFAHPCAAQGTCENENFFDTGFQMPDTRLETHSYSINICRQ